MLVGISGDPVYSRSNAGLPVLFTPLLYPMVGLVFILLSRS